MRRSWWSALILSVSIVGVALGASDPDVLEHNRRLLDRWRADPEHHARLQRDLRAFYALPSARQEQLRSLDRQLHEAAPSTQTRLWATLERYNAWLEALPEEQRQSISKAPDAATRLARIREIRSNDWYQRLPKSDQQTVSQLPPEEQADRIATLRFEDRQRRMVWYTTWLSAEAAVPRPTKLAELPAETKAFVEANLWKRLNNQEKSKLSKAEGKYPEWLRVLEALSEMHPVLPALQADTSEKNVMKNVPKNTMTAYRFGKIGKGKAGKGRPWPEFALDITRFAKELKMPIPPLGASKPEEFSPPIQQFIKEQLIPSLSPHQKRRLVSHEGQWPEYPKQLHALAKEYQLYIPGMSLPGPVEMWETARAEGVVSIDGLLNDYARNELSPHERAQLQLKSDDWKGNLDKLQSFFNHKKAEMEKMHKNRRSH